MNVYQTVRSWVVLLLAEVLNVSVSVAELVLRNQPRWLAQLRLLETELRHGAASNANGVDGAEAMASAGGGPDEPGAAEVRNVLASYAILNRALLDLQANGLALDESLMGRMRRDWNVDSILGYLETCDAQLRKRMSAVLDEATAALGTASLTREFPHDTARAQPEPGKAKASS